VERSAQAGGAALALAALLLAAPRVQADPLLEGPPVHVVPWGDGPEWVDGVGVVGEVRAVGVGSAARLASWPDRALGIEMQTPALVSLRVGLVGWLQSCGCPDPSQVQRIDELNRRDQRLVIHKLRQDAERPCAPWQFVARVDLAELNRPFIDGPLAATVSSVIDDLYVRWTPARAASLLVGRAPVVWSKTRQWEESEDPLGGPPFLIDRVAPDRRWGLALVGDLGAMSYAAGVHEDLDDLEPRPRPADASTGGQLAASGQVEWTPFGPMRRPATPGAYWPLPSPRADPWYAVPRLSLGLGLLWRRSDTGDSRIDVAFSTQTKWRWTALLAEAVISRAAEETLVGGHAGVALTPIDRLVLSGRVEWDPGAGGEGRWTLLGGATWYQSNDRRNKLGLIGWVRRDVERGTMFDAVVVLLEAVL
jgi:hypothetical protein